MKNDKEKKKEEFIKNGGLSDSGNQKIVSQIIDKIYDSNFSFALDYNSPDNSRIDWTNKKIWIRIIPHTKQIRFIWDLLHEYGHFLSGEKTINSDDLDELKREEEAWDNALKEMTESYSKLLTEIEDFKLYREHCLTDYRKKHEFLKKKLDLP